MKESFRTGCVWSTLMLAGCADVIDLDPIETSPPVEAVVRPPPISGGTLGVMADVVVAADPDRDAVFVVDMSSKKLRYTIALEPGDEPGRVVGGADTLAHVVLRGSGSVVAIDTATGAVASRRRVCGDPRGIAYDGAAAVLHVACADGTLVTFPEDPEGVATRRTIEPDLRDVAVVDGRLVVSRFRSSEVLFVGDESSPVAQRLRPVDDGVFEPQVGWRIMTRQNGDIVVLHQLADRQPVPIESHAPDPDGGGFGPGGIGGAPYGGGGEFPCSPGIAETAVTVFASTWTLTLPVFDAAVAVDAALSPDGEEMAIAIAGARPDEPPVVLRNPDGGDCFEDRERKVAVSGQITSVAFDTNGRLWMQSREPAAVHVRDASGSIATVDLRAESRFDTAHELFHRATDAGIACASCHPEGGDDGHVWTFETLGPRRTQPLEVGLKGMAPFHWDGDMDSFGTLVKEVFAHRMGGMRQSKERVESFERWLFALERPPVQADVPPNQISQGEALFTSLGCVSCHSGDKLSNNTTVELSGQTLQVPSLRRVSLRPPFMHDGRVATLEDAVRDMIASTLPGKNVSDSDVAAMAAFLRTR